MNSVDVVRATDFEVMDISISFIIRAIQMLILKKVKNQQRSLDLDRTERTYVSLFWT